MSIAQKIVDNLIEGMFSDDEMAEFGDVANHILNWVPGPGGSSRCHFKLLHYGAYGEIYLWVSDPDMDGHARSRFSINVNMEEAHQAANAAHSRLMAMTVKWQGQNTLWRELEEFLRGPVTVLLKHRKLTSNSLTKLVNQFRETVDQQA